MAAIRTDNRPSTLIIHLHATMQTVISPDNIHIHKGNRVYDGVFDSSLNFRVELEYDAVSQFIRRIGGYNEFEAETVIESLECVDRMIPRDSQGNRRYRISVGREGSPVIYLDVREFDDQRLDEGTIRCIRLEMEQCGLADESSCDINDYVVYRKVTFRFWWD